MEKGTIHRVKYGRTIWTADVHRDDGKRFVVHADEKLTAFLEMESAIHACGPGSCAGRSHKSVEPSRIVRLSQLRVVISFNRGCYALFPSGLLANRRNALRFGARGSLKSRNNRDLTR
jgi:hypothetical protein